MWTLAHAHGTLLALINIVFGRIGSTKQGQHHQPANRLAPVGDGRDFASRGILFGRCRYLLR